MDQTQGYVCVSQQSVISKSKLNTSSLGFRKYNELSIHIKKKKKDISYTPLTVPT